MLRTLSKCQEKPNIFARVFCPVFFIYSSGEVEADGFGTMQSKSTDFESFVFADISKTLLRVCLFWSKVLRNINILPMLEIWVSWQDMADTAMCHPARALDRRIGFSVANSHRFN